MAGKRDRKDLFPRSASRRDVLRAGTGLVAAGGVLAVAACSSLLPPPKKTVVGVRVLTDNTVNPSPAGAAAPVVLRIYALKNNVKFLQSDFATMFAGDEGYLGTDIVFRKELLVPPQANIPVKAEVAPEAEFIAAMACFRAGDQSQWRVIENLEASKVNDLQLAIAGTALNFEVVIVGSRPII